MQPKGRECEGEDPANHDSASSDDGLDVVDASPAIDRKRRCDELLRKSKQELQSLCREQGVPTSGNKDALIGRLVDAEIGCERGNAQESTQSTFSVEETEILINAVHTHDAIGACQDRAEQRVSFITNNFRHLSDHYDLLQTLASLAEGSASRVRV